MEIFEEKLLTDSVSYAKLTKELGKTNSRERMNTMKTLKDVKIGQIVKVVKLEGEGAIKRRIMDMGITKGVEIYVRKVAPFGDPIEVNLRGYELSLRKADAEMVIVE